MKLWTTPKKTKVKLLEKPKVPPASIELEKGEIVFFDHIDGMYSYCKNKDGLICHPVAWTKVEIVKEK